jgi:hypothetical protein
MSAPRTGCDTKRQEPPAGHHEPRAYVTEISVPYFGDGGVQRLHCCPALKVPTIRALGMLMAGNRNAPPAGAAGLCGR